MVSLNEMYDKYLTQGPKNFNLYELKSRLPEFLSPVREKLAKLLREVNNILFYAGIPYTTKEINDTDLKEFVIRARELRRELGILSKDYMDKAPKQEECPACGGLNTAPLDDKDECYDCGIIYTYAPHMIVHKGYYLKR